MPSKSKIIKSYKDKITALRQAVVVFVEYLFSFIKVVCLIAIFSYFLLSHYKKIPEKYVFENHFINLTAKLGLELKNVYLEGQNYTDQNILMEVLDLKLGQPILAIDIWELKRKLEKVTWIKNVTIARNFPNTLYISIIERNPIALWQKNGKFYLIDDSGFVIEEKNLEKFADLIVLIGEDAKEYGKYIINLVSKDQKLYKHVSHAIRIGERRWNVRFHNGVEVKLPEENTDIAWDYIIGLFNKKNLFGNSISTIDLRVANKLYIK